MTLAASSIAAFRIVFWTSSGRSFSSRCNSSSPNICTCRSTAHLHFSAHQLDPIIPVVRVPDRPDVEVTNRAARLLESHAHLRLDAGPVTNPDPMVESRIELPSLEGLRSLQGIDLRLDLEEGRPLLADDAVFILDLGYLLDLNLMTKLPYPVEFTHKLSSLLAQDERSRAGPCLTIPEIQKWKVRSAQSRSITSSMPSVWPGNTVSRCS